MRTSVWCIVLGSWLACGVQGQEQLFSGPQPGEKIKPFKVVQVLSPTSAKELELGTKAASADTTLLIFAHKIGEPSLGVFMEVEWYASKQKDLNAHYILLTDDVSETEQRARRWSERRLLTSSPISVSLDGSEGPGSYGLNRNAEMTVLVVKGNQVVANIPLLSANPVESPKIIEAVAQALGKPAPAMETIRAEMRADRERRRADQMMERPVFKMAPDPALGKRMVQLLSRERNNAEAIDAAVKDLRDWAGDDATKKAQLVRYSQAILEGDYQYSPDAKKALQRLAEGKE